MDQKESLHLRLFAIGAFMFLAILVFCGILYNTQEMLANLGAMLGNSQLVPAIKRLIESNDTLAKEVEAMQKEQIETLTKQILADTVESDGLFVVARKMLRASEFIKTLAYNLRAQKSNLVFIAGSAIEGKATLTIMLGDDVVAKGVDAGAVVREAAKAIQGGGGGQKFFATAGGKNPDGLNEAIEKAKSLIFAALQ
jgi:alanyl-tRNA synthetase